MPLPTQVVQGLDAAQYHVKGTMRNGRQKGERASYLYATVGGRNCYSLLDTGSEVSLLPSDLSTLSNIRITAKTLKAANGMPSYLSDCVTNH